MDFETSNLIASFVIGDGSLPKNAKNARYSCKQILAHEDYIRWQAEILSRVTPVKIYFGEAKVDSNGVNHQKTISVETRSHPFFQTLRDRNYFQGRKTVSLHDVKNFNWQSLAIWYMDDGYILRSDNKYHSGNVFLCTDNFSHAEVLTLQKLLYAKFDLQFDTRKRNDTYRLMLKGKNSHRFLEGIAPFVFPSFQYKLHTEGSLAEARDGEIV